MTAFPGFSEDSKCAKCGAPNAATKFQGDVEAYRDMLESDIRYRYRWERLERTCARCGFIWYEATLDSGKETT